MVNLQKNFLFISLKQQRKHTIYKHKLSAIWWVTKKKGEGYRKKKVIKNKVIANSKDFSRSMGLYKIHVLGVSKYIIFTKRI